MGGFLYTGPVLVWLGFAERKGSKGNQNSKWPFSERVERTGQARGSISTTPGGVVLGAHAWAETAAAAWAQTASAPGNRQAAAGGGRSDPAQVVQDE